MDIFEINGSKIRSLRESIGWSREYLSEMSGIAHRTIQDIEMGKSINPGINTILPILACMKEHIPELNQKQRSELVFSLTNALPSVDIDDLRTISSLAVASAARVAARSKAK